MLILMLEADNEYSYSDDNNLLFDDPDDHDNDDVWMDVLMHEWMSGWMDG